MPLRDVLTLEWVNAVQDGIRDLAAGKNIQTGPGMQLRSNDGRVWMDAAGAAAAGRKRGRFLVSFHALAQKLYVGRGAVGVANEAYPQTAVSPIEPTLDGVLLSDPEPPGFDGLAAGTTYRVVCIFDETAARIEAVPDADDIVLNNCERAWILAEVTLKTVAGGLAVESLIQKWESDIPWTIDEFSCDSSSGSDSDSSDSSDLSEDSDASSDDSGGSYSDSSDDSSDSDSSGGDCCPEVTITDAECFMTNFATGVDSGQCFLNASTEESVRVIVTVNVKGNPCECTGAWLNVRAGNNVIGRIYLGRSGQGSYQVFGDMMSRACKDIRIEACWYISTVGVTAEDPCRGKNCCAETEVTTPHVCDEGSCSGGSSDSSSSSSEESSASTSSGSSEESSSSGSSSSSDDSDGSSDKNCIVAVGDRYLALACIESPNTWFMDFPEVQIGSRHTRAWLDPDFVAACEPGSIRVAAVAGDRRGQVAARLDAGWLLVSCGWWRRPRRVVVTLIGLRKGSVERFPARSREQYQKSRNFWTALNR